MPKPKVWSFLTSGLEQNINARVLPPFSFASEIHFPPWKKREAIHMFFQTKKYISKHTFWFIFFVQLQYDFYEKFNSWLSVMFISCEHRFQHTMLKTL
jgi:hypothetical protein